MKIIKTPHSVEIIINELEKKGYEAFAVGGCVRDALLNKTPNDWDITTSAMPLDVKGIFNKTFDTGIKHGTITVLIDKVGYEVTTYRIDGEYLDGRHPNSVEFTSNLVEDLKRRDFTINAMAYSSRTGIVDKFDGIGDLEKRIIKCVGNPEDRFNEDALRILRAVRFAATLDFEIDLATKQAIVKLSKNLEKISKERIQAELEKLIMSDHPEKLLIAYETGITKVIFDIVDKMANENTLNDILLFLKSCPKDHYIRWAALLQFIDKETCSKILRDLKFDNKTINYVSRLVIALKNDLPISRPDIRCSIFSIGEDLYDRYVSLLFVFASFYSNHQSSNNLAIKNTEISLEKVTLLKSEYESILAANECLSLKTLAVNGKDLIALGAAKGSMVGEILNKLLMLVLEDSSLNNKEVLLKLALKFIE